MTNIFLVDDHTSVLEGTKHMIEAEEDLKVKTASDASEAIRIIENESFDLYIFDLHLPHYNGLELTKKVIDFNADAIILILSGYEFEPYFNHLIEAGVCGFISKTSSREQLITSIRCALRHEAIIPISFLRQLRRSEATAVSYEGSYLKDISISDKEHTVLYEASKGKTNKEIAHTMLLSQRMVEYHLTRIFGKLNVSSRGEAISKAREFKLIPEKELY